MKMSTLNRILLMTTGIMAAYQIAVGIDGLESWPIVSYTIGFGLLLVVVLLLLVMGYELLTSIWFSSLTVLIPVSLAAGLVLQHFPQLAGGSLAFSIVGLVTAGILPLAFSKLSVQLAALVRVISLVVIIFLPLALVLQGNTQPVFAFVGLGGAVIGVAAWLFSLRNKNKLRLSEETILKLLPIFLLLMMVVFLIGFA